MITQAEVIKYFEYKDGNLYWKAIPCKRNDLVGGKAGSDIGDNRRSITINQKRYKTHRLVYLMFYGYMPVEVDHIDNDPLNNRIENLRSATRSEQCCNSKISNRNTSGTKGITWDKSRNKWIVSINKNKKTVFRNRFDSLELAQLVVIEARNKYHGDFAKCQ